MRLHERVHLVVRDRGEQLHAVVVEGLVGDPADRLRVELAVVHLQREHLARRDALEGEDPVGQRHVVVVERHGLADRLQHRVDLGRVGQDAGAQGLVRHRLDELLLVALSAVVGVLVGQQVALAHVVERLPGREMPAADLVDHRAHVGLEPARGPVGVDVVGHALFAGLRAPADVDRGGLLVDAHVDPADRLDQALEALEVDDRGADELQPAGQPAHRLGQQLEATVPAAAVLVAELEGRVDLVVAAVVPGRLVGRDVHPRVARDRRQVDRAVVGRHVRDDDRVGPGPADRVVRALVDADEQQVDRAVDGLAGRRRAAQAAVVGDLLAVVRQQQLPAGERAAARDHQQRPEDDRQLGPHRALALRPLLSGAWLRRYWRSKAIVPVTVERLTGVAAGVRVGRARYGTGMADTSACTHASLRSPGPIQHTRSLRINSATFHYGASGYPENLKARWTPRWTHGAT